MKAMDEVKKYSKAHTRYELKDGTYVPGVTTITQQIPKPFLYKWYNKLGLAGIDSSKYMDNLADVGTLAHYSVERFVQNAEPDMDYIETFPPTAKKLAARSLETFKGWLTINPFKPIFCEKQLVSEELKFGGTCDMYGEIYGKKVLIDIKTSKNIYLDHEVQTVAYRRLLLENGYDVDECRILKVGRDENEGFTDHLITEYDMRFRYFCLLLDSYRLHKQIKKEV